MDFTSFIMSNNHHWFKLECTNTMKKHPVGYSSFLGNVLLKRPKTFKEDQQDHKNYGSTTQRIKQPLFPMLLQPAWDMIILKWACFLSKYVFKTWLNLLISFIIQHNYFIINLACVIHFRISWQDDEVTGAAKFPKEAARIGYNWANKICPTIIFQEDMKDA